MGSYRFLLSGGGTGGHIYPAIAIADELKRRYPDAEFLFVGAKDRMEMEKVPQAGYKIKGLWISGLQRKLSLKNLLFPIKLIQSLMKASAIVRKFKPDVVIGTGGFASGPTLRMAEAKGVPTVLQEQNSFAGITNKWLASKARKIFVAYENMERFFPEDKIVFTGNPVRQDIVEKLPDAGSARKSFGLDEGKTTLLVLGGSLGAARINSLLADELDFLLGQDLQVLWQCGKLYYEKYKDYEQEGVKVVPFIARMQDAYAAADIIISRAGAGTVSELCLVGKAVLFVPSPHVAEDHQRKNAEAIVEKEAALMLQEKDLEERFRPVFEDLLRNPEQIQQYGTNMKTLARPEATVRIVDEIEKLL